MYIFFFTFALLGNTLLVSTNETDVTTRSTRANDVRLNSTPIYSHNKKLPSPEENDTLLSYIEGRRSGHLNTDGGSDADGDLGYDGPHIDWGWDKWCQLQPKVGDCHDRHNYFYYQVKTDTCREFTYTGCNGNQNKFNTRAECEHFCRGYGTSMDTKSLTDLELCSLQPNPGNCLGFLSRYYHDINLGECREFTFGGCGGNPNRFMDKPSCLSRCASVDLGSQIQRSLIQPKGE